MSTTAAAVAIMAPRKTCAREVINTLETLGNPTFSENHLEIARIIKKIGLNPTISRKTLTFSFSHDYQLLPSLLGSARVAQPQAVSATQAENRVSSKWCAREDLNLHPFRDQILSLARLPFRHSRVGHKDAMKPSSRLKKAFAGQLE